MGSLPFSGGMISGGNWQFRILKIIEAPGFESAGLRTAGSIMARRPQRGSRAQVLSGEPQVTPAGLGAASNRNTPLVIKLSVRQCGRKRMALLHSAWITRMTTIMPPEPLTTRIPETTGIARAASSPESGNDPMPRRNPGCSGCRPANRNWTARSRIRWRP